MTCIATNKNDMGTIQDNFNHLLCTIVISARNFVITRLLSTFVGMKVTNLKP